MQTYKHFVTGHCSLSVPFPGFSCIFLKSYHSCMHLCIIQESTHMIKLATVPILHLHPIVFHGYDLLHLILSLRAIKYSHQHLVQIFGTALATFLLNVFFSVTAQYRCSHISYAYAALDSYTVGTP